MCAIVSARCNKMISSQFPTASGRTTHGGGGAVTAVWCRDCDATARNAPLTCAFIFHFSSGKLEKIIGSVRSKRVFSFLHSKPEGNVLANLSGQCCGMKHESHLKFSNKKHFLEETTGSSRQVDSMKPNWYRFVHEAASLAL